MGGKNVGTPLRGQRRADGGDDGFAALAIAVLEHDVVALEKWEAVLLEPKHHSSDDHLTRIRSDVPGNMPAKADELHREGRADLCAGAVVDDRRLNGEGEGIARQRC